MAVAEADWVGFIGLGAMGMPIAANLVATGIPLRVYNRTREKAESWLASLPAGSGERVQLVSSPRDAVPAPNGVVFTIASHDAALESITEGPEGVLEALGPQGVHVCLSTVSPGATERQAARHQERGAAYVASPVWGRPPAAAARKLIIVAGGPVDAVARVTPLLEAIGQKVVNAGERAQASSILKLAGNFMILALIEAQAEAFTLAESAGVPRETTYDLLTGPTGVFNTLPIMSIYGKMVAAHDYEPVGFTGENGLKDARLMCDAAAEGGVDMPVARLVRDRLAAMVEEPGGRERDWASFAKQVTVQPRQG